MTKDIERVEEILSSKEKFLENIWGVKFELRILDIVTRLTKTTNYSAYVIKEELEKFYDRYKARICDKLKLELRYVEADYFIMDRSKYGDYFKKPTQFWFLNCEPRNGLVAVNYDSKPVKKIINERGINRSLISKDFIRVFLSEIVDLEGEAVNKKYD